MRALLGGECSRALWCVSTLPKPLAFASLEISGFLLQLREKRFVRLIEGLTVAQ